MRKIALAVVASAIALGGCVPPKVSGTPMVAPDSIYEAPAVTITEKGVVLRKDSQAAYCRGEVAGMYGTRPQYVKTMPLVVGADGSVTIDGTVNRGSQGIKKFQCRYSARGALVDVNLHN
ncbi:hypothetical protein [Phyllobacterium zundukense]|uniref:Lipoprotein n=1 Tax=Phyllobacterium zundukense TaxID=1867719 RepID=A0A2N9W2L7_9HYPH|nr:hypothetical protein [Phyllobacterium zundukense]ATU91050.1 hypothetical protein BLM14_04945 [Phyllobacterium zundukense]PIO45985.1 hypothetical protein B5P45_05495 [Phyllobacterium zundukense]